MSLFCECAEWAPNIAKVSGPMVTMALRRGSTVAYDGVQFRYCPWCGTGLKESVELNDRAAAGAAGALTVETLAALLDELYARDADNSTLEEAAWLLPRLGAPGICAHPFDSMLCVALANHEGPHITSNAAFPHGLPRLGARPTPPEPGSCGGPCRPAGPGDPGEL